MITLAAISLDPRIGELEVNCDLIGAAVDRALAAGARLIVLPELATSGYVFRSRAEASSVAIAAQDSFLADLAGRAGAAGAVIVLGICERIADGRLFNSAVVLDATGVRAVYRKTHLWDREKLVFAPGADPAPVLATTVGRIGVLVCYDLEFPEMPRRLALQGAEIIAVPTNWPLVPRPAGEHPPEVINAMAQARVNRVFIACADRCGSERGVAFTGGTCLVDPEGWLLARATQPDIALADVDPSLARRKAISPRNDVLADRRPELYGEPTSDPQELHLV